MGDGGACRPASVVVLIVIFLVLTTVVGSSLATTFRMAFVATTLPAIIAALLAAALVPDGVSHHVQSFDWSNRVVARDDQLTAYRTFFGGFVSNDNAQTRTWMQRRRERIVDQLPMTVLALERHARHVQVAIADVTD